jgi:hypothetical protein
MIIEPISLLEAHRFSSWPKRVLGLEEWQKKTRVTKDIIEEYNNGWYKYALSFWEEALRSRNFASPLAFFYQLDKIILGKMLEAKEIYGIHEDRHLISSGDHFFVCSNAIFNSLYRTLLLETTDKYLAVTGCKSVVETGCGTGVNLFCLSQYLPVDQFAGGEICSNAIKLGNAIAEKFCLNGNFRHFDYFNSGKTMPKLVEDIKGDYILFTSHSIEQIGLMHTDFIEAIRDLEKPPKVVIHFEPAVYPDTDNLMEALCYKYSNLNKYNHDLLQVLKTFQERKILTIVEHIPRTLGTSAFNPTSVIVWKLI